MEDNRPLWQRQRDALRAEAEAADPDDLFAVADQVEQDTPADPVPVMRRAIAQIQATLDEELLAPLQIKMEVTKGQAYTPPPCRPGQHQWELDAICGTVAGARVTYRCTVCTRRVSRPMQAEDGAALQHMAEARMAFQRLVAAANDCLVQ